MLCLGGCFNFWIYCAFVVHLTLLDIRRFYYAKVPSALFFSSRTVIFTKTTRPLMRTSNTTSSRRVSPIAGDKCAVRDYKVIISVCCLV